ncbi:MAG: hypothetical protein WBK55_08295 [Alphaproteobacteria bacterium]
MVAAVKKIRGYDAATIAADIPAEREIMIDTSAQELILGDGATTGGVARLPNCVSLQNQSKTHASIVAGDENDIVLTVLPVPSAWVEGMGGSFKAAANNTDVVTITIDDLSGTKAAKKRTPVGLADLDPDDLIEDGTYRWQYNGSVVIIESLHASSGLISVSQGNLETSIGTFSASAGTSIGGGALFTSTSHITTPGGEYGFKVLSRIASGNNSGAQGWWESGLTGSYVSSVVPWRLPTETPTVGGQQRYITSSPPFFLGDDEKKDPRAHAFIYLLLDGSNNILSTYTADVPPYAYNGPTDIRAQKICPITKKKFRKVMVPRSLEEIMDGAKIEYEYQEITQALKNADMDVIPHPFGQIAAGEKVVLLDPADRRLEGLIKYQNAGGTEDIMQALLSGKIYFDADPIKKRKGPAGVTQLGLRYRYSGRN